MEPGNDSFGRVSVSIPSTALLDTFVGPDANEYLWANQRDHAVSLLTCAFKGDWIPCRFEGQIGLLNLLSC